MGNGSMKILFISSSLDPAGKNLVDILKKFVDFRLVGDALYVGRDGDWLLKIVDVDIIATDFVDRDIEADVNIFLSKHSSQSGMKTLSVHPTGNPLNEAMLGGRPKSLAPCHPPLMNQVLRRLYKNNLDVGSDYTVTMEVTHHGPTELRNPSFFVEIGSSYSEWSDRKAAEIVISSLLDAIESYIEGQHTSESIFVGFGGPHYAPRFTNAVIKKGYTVGHILSKYSVERGVDREVILDAFGKSMNAKRALIDWKGLKSAYRRSLIQLLDDVGLGYEKA